MIRTIYVIPRTYVQEYYKLEGAMSNEESLNMTSPALGDKESGCDAPTLVNPKMMKTTENAAVENKGTMELESPLDPLNLSQEVPSVKHTEGHNSPTVLIPGTQIGPHTNSGNKHTAATQDTNWTKVVHNNKRKTPFLTATAPDNLKPSVTTQIKQRGEAAIDAETRLITDVKLEFSTKSRKDINIRSEFVNFLSLCNLWIRL